MSVSIRRLGQRLLWRRRLRRFLQADDPTVISADRLAREFSAADPRSIERLWKKITIEADRMRIDGSLSPDKYRELTEALRNTDPQLLSERLSPLHPLLLDKEFYRLSDVATREWLRRSFARFAKRHRLSPKSAALLWQGERCRPIRYSAGMLLCSILSAAAVGWIGVLMCPAKAAVLLLTALPAVFTGVYLISAALLRRLLPDSPLPQLESSAGHSVLRVLVGRFQDADASLDQAQSIVSGTGEDCLLLLTLPDVSVSPPSNEQAQIDLLTKRAEELSRQSDSTVTLVIPPRRYRPGKWGKARWIGRLTVSELAEVIAHSLQGLSVYPEAIAILPIGGTLMPIGEEGMASALFHPLCPSDALVFLTPSASPLPLDRLTVLRQCLLQKYNAPSDLVGWGIYRTDALLALAKGEMLSPRLASQPLFTEQVRSPSACTPVLRQTPTLLPCLRLLLPLSRTLLLLGIVAARLPPSLSFLLWTVASADLSAAALLSLRTGRRFFLYTLPAWKRLAAAFVNRSVLPMQDLLPRAGSRLPWGLCLLSLAFGSTAIAIGTPWSILGLGWIIAPLLQSDIQPSAELTPALRGACYALAEELYPYLQRSEDALPPAYLTKTGENALYTTPAVLGTHLAAEISACDLGLIDPYTLERRVEHLLRRLEGLPTRCGLPYARYDTQTGEFYKDSRVDTVTVGLYALCLAAAESGLSALAIRNPSLRVLSQRIAHLQAQMDLTLLLNGDLSLCRALTPEGEREGQLTCFAGGGGLTLCAILTSDSAQSLSGKQKIAAWNTLLSPSEFKEGHCLILSENGTLDDYWLPLQLLPIPRDSLISDAAARAVRAALREGSKKNDLRAAAPPHPRCNPSSSSLTNHFHVHSLRNWPRLSAAPPPISAGCDSLSVFHACPQKEITAPLLCLLLQNRPRFALSHLQRLQKASPDGGFADPIHPEQIPVDGLALSLIALAGAVTHHTFAERLSALPRFCCLAPLLGRRPDSAVESKLPIPTSVKAIPVATASAPSVLLMGDAENALLIAKGHGICIWRNKIPLTSPASSAAPLIGGRGSGLLLQQNGKPFPLPHTVYRRSAGELILSDNGVQCRITQTASDWTLCWERADSAPTDLRFLLCPALPEARLWEDRMDTNGRTTVCLGVEYSPSLTLLAAIEGIESPFTHADPSPFPQGSNGIRSVFSIRPHTADGIVRTPSCMIGGRWSDKRLTLRLILAKGRADAITQLHSPTASRMIVAYPISQPAPDGSLASRVLEWQIRSLFSAAPIPSAMAVGSAGSDRDYLARCLTGGNRLLSEKGFPQSEEIPLPLQLSRREGAEALINRLLSTVPEDVETSLLPAEEQITYPDGFPRILRGRNRPTSARGYANGIARLSASPDGLEFTPVKGALPIRLTFRLFRGARDLLLPAAATAVRYAPAEVSFEGEDFSLRAALLPRLPLLAITLEGAGDARLCAPQLPPPCREEEGERFYSLPAERLLFIRRFADVERTVWLIGAFPRGRDRLYYLIRSAVTPLTLPPLLADTDRRLRSAASLLRIENRAMPALPSIVSAILASDSPARALLTPLCTPEVSIADLIRLANSPPTLLFPMALALRVAVTDETVAERRVPVEGGRASLYLLAARCLEQAMEEAPQHPLLPPIVSAFTRLAERLGDHTGKQLYAAFAPTEAAQPVHWNAFPEASPETVRLLSDLSVGKSGAASALLAALSNLPVSPAPTDAALLYCGLLWGVMGFTPSALGDGFSLAPSAVEEEITFLLTCRGEWRITLTPGAAPICTRADALAVTDGAPTQKIFRNRKFSPQNGCIVHKNSVK